MFCSSNRSHSPNLEKELTCVSCSHICLPPEKIFQCEEGDLLCSKCEENKDKLQFCPECNSKLPETLARNKALEKMARKHYCN